MTKFRRFIVLGCVFPVLALAACGEGWEVVEMRGQVPYTQDRTAGPGVKYVRAYMLPEKGPVLEQQPVVSPPTKVEDAQPLFDHKQLKK